MPTLQQCLRVYFLCVSPSHYPWGNQSPQVSCKMPFKKFSGPPLALAKHLPQPLGEPLAPKSVSVTFGLKVSHPSKGEEASAKLS